MPIRHLRHPGRTFLLVAPGGRPLAVLRGLPRSDRMPRAPEGEVLVYDLGRLERSEHDRLVDALAALRELPYLADGAPAPLLVGGTPALVVGQDGKRSGGGLGLLDLLRNAR